MNAFTLNLLERLAWSAPFLVLDAMAIGICIRHREQNPSSAKWFLSAFFLIGIASILSILKGVWFSRMADPMEHHSIGTLSNLYGSASVLIGLMNLAGWSLLVFAVHRVFHPLAEMSEDPLP